MRSCLAVGCRGLAVAVSIVVVLLYSRVGAYAEQFTNSFGDHTYVFETTGVDWGSASNAAAQAGGYLVVVNSAAENDFLFTNLVDSPVVTRAMDGGYARYVWLGAYQAGQLGIADENDKAAGWRWVDGSDLSVGYTNWGTGYSGKEPDDYAGPENGDVGQDYLALGLEAWPFGSGGAMGDASEWNDINDDSLLAYVIEIEPAPVVNADDDADMLPDAWEVYYFTNAANASATNDWDGDGISNRDEYLAGTSPTNRSSGLRLETLYSNGVYLVRYVGHEATGSGYDNLSRVYDMFYTTNIMDANAWMLLSGATNVPGSNAYHAVEGDTTQAATYYKVRARLE